MRQSLAAHPLMLFLRANRRPLLLMLGASLLVNILVLAYPLFSMLVYDKAVGNSLHETLWALFIGICLSFALEIALRMARVLVVEHAGARWDMHMDDQLVQRLLTAPLSSRLGVGEVLARYREMGLTRDVLSAQFLLPLVDIPFTILFLVVLASISPWLTVVPMGMAVLLFTVSVALQTVSKYRQRAANEAHNAKLNWLTDLLLTRESLTDPGAAALVRNAIRKPAHEGARAASRARLWSQMSQQTTTVGISLVSALTLLVGVYLIDNQAISIGALTSSTILSSRIVVAVCGLAPVITRWQEFMLSLRSLSQTVGLKAREDSKPTEASLQGSAFQTEGLRVEGLEYKVNLGQENERSILEGLSFSLHPGELVVVVGASGAGKSTLLRLLAGHLSPTKGRLAYAATLIEGEVARQWLAAQVTFKPQEPVFIGGSVLQIVAPNQHNVDETAIVNALRSAGLGPALDKGTLGLASTVGTNGAGVSGGQRQMLALARVLASPRDLLIMDEPTLGLDRTAQESVLKALHELRQKGRCLCVATHASELIQIADRVLVLDNGRLVADAAPAKLLKT